MISVERIVRDLRKQRDQAQSEVHRLDRAIEALSEVGRRGRGGPRRMSKAARKRIAAAQRARWAKIKGKTKPKRRISAAGRKRIAAAQRARWAKVRAAKGVAAQATAN